jgi:hypothetical protein
MKFRAVLFIPALILSGAFLTSSASATFVGTAREGGEKPADKNRAQQVERTASAESKVVVSVCLLSGNITVRGWDRKEVRARSNDAARIELRGGSGKTEPGPAKKLEVLVSDKPELPRLTTSCQGFSDLELNVPRGATVQLQTRDGDISVAEVGTAYVNTQNGDISIERVSQSVDAGSIGGTIALKNSSGRINLHSIGGSIEANDVRPVEAGDLFEASSVSGDVLLGRVTYVQLNAHTVNGSLSLSGPLVHGGHYGFRTYSGDVTLILPADASFRLSAKISQRGEIVTDFPLILTTEANVSAGELPTPPVPAAPPQAKGSAKGPAPTKGVATHRVVVTVPPYSLQRLNAVHGTGDAIINLASFSGTVHLRKK